MKPWTPQSQHVHVYSSRCSVLAHQALGLLLIRSGAFIHLQLKLVVVGALGGRFDHEAANINVLHTFAKDLRIVLLSEESSLTVLPAGHVHDILVDRSFEGPHCGLVPIGAPSLSTTSTGLRWNLSMFKTPSLPCISHSEGFERINYVLRIRCGIRVPFVCK